VCVHYKNIDRALSSRLSFPQISDAWRKRSTQVQRDPIFYRSYVDVWWYEKWNECIRSIIGLATENWQPRAATVTRLRMCHLMSRNCRANDLAHCGVKVKAPAAISQNGRFEFPHLLCFDWLNASYVIKIFFEKKLEVAFWANQRHALISISGVKFCVNLVPFYLNCIPFCSEVIKGTQLWMCKRIPVTTRDAARKNGHS